MIDQVHKHIIAELQQNTKTDTIFILTAIILNLITLAVNSGMSEQSRTDNASLIVMFIFVSLIIVVNIVVIIGLLKGKQTRQGLLKGLVKMYEDKGVDKYYDIQMLNNYKLRYNLFILVVIFTAIIATAIPFVLR